MSNKRYVVAFFLLFPAALLLVAAFNRVVDPFWYYRDISIRGFNQVKTKFRRYERHVKPEILVREQPDAVIFGSSYSEIGFDPTHLSHLVGGSAYNFALAGASWDRVYCDTQFAMRYDQKLRWIVLGIHPQSMPERDCRKALYEMRHPDELSFLLSADALNASVETVLEQRKDPPSHTAQGLYFYTRGKPGTADRFRQYLPTHGPCIPGKAGAGADPGLDLKGLRHLLQEALMRHVSVRLVVYPRHAMPVEQEYLCGARQERWKVLSSIVAMTESLAGTGPSVEVWDFEGFHKIATEKISEAPAVFWQDPAHFNYEYGNVMLDEMFGRSAALYGARLTSKNMKARQEDERAAREAYIRLHPGFDRQLMSLLGQHG
jgi:hypothetical protein